MFSLAPSQGYLQSPSLKRAFLRHALDINQTLDQLPSSSFNRFTRSIGDVIAYTTGDVSSGILTLSRGLGKYIPLPSDRKLLANESLLPDIVSVSSFKNLSDHSLVEVSPVIDTQPSNMNVNISVPSEYLPPPKKGILYRIKSLFRRIPRQEGDMISQRSPKRSIFSRFLSWITRRKPYSPSSASKPSLLKRFRNKMGLILRRRVYNIWERPPPLWSKFKLKNVGMHVTKPKSLLFPAQKEKGLLRWNIFSFLNRRNDDAEYLDLESDDGKTENYHIFKDSQVNAKLSDNKGLIRSVLNGISTSKDYLTVINGAGSAIMKMNRLEGLFSDGKNLMSVSVQLLSNATEASLSGLNVDYIGGAGSLFIKTLASTPSIIGNFGILNRGNNDVMIQQIQSEETEEMKKSSIQSLSVPEPTKIEGNSFFPLIRFIRRKVFGRRHPTTLSTETPTKSIPGVVNAIPVVRLLPRVSGWVQQVTESSSSASSSSASVPVADAEVITRQNDLLPASPTNKWLSIPALPFVSQDSSSNFQLQPKGFSLANYRSPQQIVFPQPSKADMILVKTTRIVAGVKAAATVRNQREFNEFMNNIGLRPLLAAIIRPPTSRKELRLEAVRALRQLLKHDSKIIPTIISKDIIFDVLTEMMQASLQYNLGVFRSESEKIYKNMEQFEALALILRLVRESDIAVESIRKRPRLIQILNQIRSMGDDTPDELHTINKDDIMNILSRPVTERRFSNSTVFVDYDDLKPYEMVIFYLFE